MRGRSGGGFDGGDSNGRGVLERGLVVSLVVRVVVEAHATKRIDSSSLRAVVIRGGRSSLRKRVESAVRSLRVLTQCRRDGRVRGKVLLVVRGRDGGGSVPLEGRVRGGSGVGTERRVLLLFGLDLLLLVLLLLLRLVLLVLLLLLGSSVGRGVGWVLVERVGTLAEGSLNALVL